MKKVFLLFLCLIIAVGTFVACDKNDPEKPTDEITIEETTVVLEEKLEDKMTIGYFKGKGLNPYKTESNVNRSLLSLVYDSLFIIEEDYSASPLIADSFTNEGNKLTVKLREDAVFSDGSALSASDVAYSFRIAKDNAFYKARLSNFVSAAAGDDNIVFTLKKSDIFAEGCLSFPIIKIGSAGENYPLGTGRYSVKREKGELLLKANETNTRNEEMITKTIYLTPISSEKSEFYLLQTGDLTYLFDDLSSGNFSKINANMVKLHLNNLVYLGFNSKNGSMKDRNVRNAVMASVNKTAIASTAYGNYCTVAHNVFNPYWFNNEITEAEKENLFSTAKAEEILEKADYIYAYKKNKYRSKDFDFLTATFVVNSESAPKVKAAKMITKELRKIGIDVDLKILDFNEYERAIKNESFDLYLGELKLSPNMDLSAFFGNGGNLRFGIDRTSASAKAYFDFAAGTINLATFKEVFSYEKPFIPILYRDGMACFSRELSYEGSINEFDMFKNAYSWEIV